MILYTHVYSLFKKNNFKHTAYVITSALIIVFMCFFCVTLY